MKENKTEVRACQPQMNKCCDFGIQTKNGDKTQEEQ